MRSEPETTLRDGTRVVLRPLRAGDRGALRRVFERLSPASRERRFFAPIGDLTPQMLDRLTDVDDVDRFAWLAFTRVDGGEREVGIARYARLPGDPEAAEAAVTLVDDYQGRGIGTLLLRALSAVARENGVRRLVGSVLQENVAMRAVLRDAGARLDHDSPGVLCFTVEL